MLFVPPLTVRYNAPRMSGGASSSTGRKRPVVFRALCVALLGVGAINLGVALRTIQLAPRYMVLGVSFSPPLLVLVSVGWGAGFLWVAWRLWRLRAGAPRLAVALVSAYGLFQVGWWRLFARADYTLLRWPFAALLTALVVALVAWYLYRPRVRTLFRVETPGTPPVECEPVRQSP